MLGHFGNGMTFFAQRAGWADMHALTATGAALRFAPGLRQIGDHERFAAPPHHVPGVRTLDFIAHAHAASAQNTAVLIQHEAGMTGIYRKLRINIMKTDVIDAEKLGQPLQLAVAIGDAHAANVIALGEQHLQNHAAVLVEPRAFSTDLHPLSDPGGAGGHKLGASFHLHQA